MSDSRNASPTVADVPLTSSVPSPSSQLVRLGGFFGIVGCVLGLCLLMAGCGGFGKGLALSPVAAGLGFVGLLLVLVGGLTRHRRIGEDTHVLQAAFACVMSTLGGVLEMAVWMNWHIFK